MLWTEFPDELPKESLSLVFDVWRGRTINLRKAALAAANVVGFITGQTIGENDEDLIPAHGTGAGAASGTVSEVEAAFSAALAAPTPFGAQASILGGNIDWQLILGVAIQVLERLRKR